MKLFHRAAKKKSHALLQRVLGEIQSLTCSLPGKEEKACLQECIRDVQARELDLSDILPLEKLLVRTWPEPVLRNKAGFIRDRFKTVAGDDAYRARGGKSLSDPDTIDRERLIAELDTFLDEIYSCYMYEEEWRRRMARQKTVVTLFAMICFGAIVLFLFYSTPYKTDLLIFLMMGAGLLGAFVSILRRMQSSENMIFQNKDPNIELMNFRYGTTGFLVALLSGAVFPLLLFVIFAGNFVSGVIFPKITFHPEPLPDTPPYYFVSRFMESATPDSFVEFSKMVVWSFIAGFAERFVPDMLDRIVGQAQKSAGPEEKM